MVPQPVGCWPKPCGALDRKLHVVLEGGGLGAPVVGGAEGVLGRLIEAVDSKAVWGGHKVGKGEWHS